MSRTLLALVVAAVSLATGCQSTDCQATCQRIWDDSQCGIEIPQISQAEALTQCIQGCEYALTQPGELGDYDPNVPNRSGDSIQLENERQAAEWMECVQAVSCEDISDGVCAPKLPQP